VFESRRVQITFWSQSAVAGKGEEINAKKDCSAIAPPLFAGCPSFAFDLLYPRNKNAALTGWEALI
jgi:hypothetical protein